MARTRLLLTVALQAVLTLIRPHSISQGKECLTAESVVVEVQSLQMWHVLGSCCQRCHAGITNLQGKKVM